MEFWKIAALSTWGIIFIIISVYIYSRKKWFSYSKDILLGQRLHNSVDQLFDEIANKDIRRTTLSNVIKHVLWRLTRIGLFAILAALIPILFLSIQTYFLGNQNKLLNNQNNLLKNQTDRLNMQNNLIEAQRRGSLVLLMSNILDQINDEIKEQRKNPDFNDSLGYSLSKPLIGRIAGLSHGFLPYRILQGDTLTKKEYSLERGQLLLALANNKLDSVTTALIYQSTSFKQSYLRKANLYKANLSSIDLSNSYLGEADFTNANLSGANLTETYSNKADFKGANLSFAYLVRGDFREVKLIGSNLKGANMSSVNLSKAILSGADLSHALLGGNVAMSTNLQAANLSHADMYNVNLSGALFKVKNLRNTNMKRVNFSRIIYPDIQLFDSVTSLYETKNLNPKIRNYLTKSKPCVFVEEGCK